MFKKLVIASAVFAASSGVALAGHVYRGDYKCEAPCAAPCATPCCQPFCAAPYVGFSLYPKVVIAGHPAAYKGFGGNLFAGYGAMMSCSFYLAGELFVGDTWKLKDYTVNNHHHDDDAVVVDEHEFGGSVRSTWDVGASIIPGYLITDCILTYLRLGATNSHFNNNHHHHTVLVDGVEVEHHHGNGNNSKTGWHIGIGGQATICQNWDLRGEYIYTQYGRIRDVGHPQADQFNLGLIYKFL